MENIEMKVIRQDRVTFVHEDGSFYSPLRDKPFLINTNHSLIEDERTEADIKEKDGSIADGRVGNSTRARFNRTLDTLSAVFVPFTSYEQMPVRISLYDEKEPRHEP